MNVEAYLDYNELLKVAFEIGADDISYALSFDSENKRQSDRIVKNLSQITSLEPTENPDVYRLSINDSIYVNVSKSSGELEVVSKLTAFETRSLGQSKQRGGTFSRDKKSDFVPKTDLHTHFAGALSPDILVDVGIKNNIGYPKKLLDSIGIDTSSYEVGDDGNILLSSIGEKDIKALKEALAMPIATQELFNKLEEVYVLRGPMTKNKALFPDLLAALAEDYAKNGVEYAELSLSDVLSTGNGPEYMQMMEDNLPAIEEKTGVKLRFLAALWRHSDKEWNLDETDRMMTVADSRYVVGSDVMGQEANETKVVEEELRQIARRAMEKDPDFSIRVHAGENAMYKDNVKEVLEIIQDEHRKYEEETGKEQPMPRVRIGHGLYGVDKEVLELAKQMGAIIEFNMSSNLALNNINSITEIPIKSYLDAGVKVVLGTDGHGLYSTTGEQEVILAMAAGLEPEDFEKIAETEREVLEVARRREESHRPIDDVRALYSSITYSSEDKKARWTDELANEKREMQARAREELAEKIHKTGAITDPEQIAKDTDGKTPIVITGASMKAWKNISEENQENVELAMQVLADVLNPETAYVVTGGTHFGAEKVMHEAVQRRNQKEDGTLVALGTFTMEALKDSFEGVLPDTITHATMLQLNGRNATGWLQLPDTQLEYLRERNGHMIAIGGGAIVEDMIQRAHNLGVDMHLMDGPEGGSTNKSRSLAGNDYSFQTVEEMLTRIFSKNPEMFKEGFSLENVASYIEEAKARIAESKGNFGKDAMAEVDKGVSQADRAQGITDIESAAKGVEEVKATDDSLKGDDEGNR